ncbi:MAG TPA: hypothetical protein PK020_15690 [Ilumatobacteraceae bacterium]|nr:hypothetical protein [Ilumatobacteraceae bacterium]HRB04345.1 hypothetical protein [Ilumatobacteraceae bacterium]
MRRLALMALVTLSGIAACGDDSTSSASTVGSVATTTTPVNDSPAEATLPSDQPDQPDPSAAGIGSDFCNITDELNAADFDPFSATPAEVETFYTVDFPDMFGRLSAAAPTELKVDVATVGAAYEVLIADLASNGWDMKTSFANPEVQATMTGDTLDAAGGHLDEYCGL